MILFVHWLANIICLLQVQAIGLQILKGVLTRKINSESYSFFIFFVGELVEDLGSVIQKLFKVDKVQFYVFSTCKS